MGGGAYVAAALVAREEEHGRGLDLLRHPVIVRHLPRPKPISGWLEQPEEATKTG